MSTKADPGGDSFEVEVERARLCCSTRLVLACLAFFGCVNAYLQRAAMSVSIVCMVNHTAVRLEREAAMLMTSSNESSFADDTSTYGNYTLAVEDPECGTQTGNSSVNLHEDGSFVWSKTIQGHLLGCFFYGYMVSQIPLGMLAERIGGKLVFATCMGLATLGTVLTPMAARISVPFLIFIRVLIGLGSGGLFPVLHATLSHWAPPLERSILITLSLAGASFGNVVAYPLAALLCEYGFDGGWPTIFYVFGMTGSAWLILWLLLVSDSPATHKSISAKEKSYILHSLRGQISTKTSRSTLPWLKALTSMPVWAVIVGTFISDWGLYTLLTNTPTYLFEVFHFDIKANGFYSALPFLGVSISMNVASLTCDKIRSSGILSTTVTRKLFQDVGFLGAAIFLVLLSFLDCNHPKLAIVFLTAAVTLSGFAYSGFWPNIMDITPRYAGTVCGLCNTVAATSGFIAPYVAAVLTPNQTQAEWQKVFFIASGLYVVGAIFYTLFASGEILEWAKEAKDSEAALASTEETARLNSTKTADINMENGKSRGDCNEYVS